MIKQKLKKIQSEIRLFEKQYQRAPGSVQLLAVSKTFPPEAVKQAYQAGQCDFGENYLQDALGKIQAISHKDIVWHYIGQIQSNKTADIARYFDWVHTLDREKIAHRLNRQRTAEKQPLNCLIQVNISNEKSKNGLTKQDEILQLAHTIDSLENLSLRGLMTIPKKSTTFEEQKNEFSKLVHIFAKLQKSFPYIDSLSMGMTQDMEAAIAAGSNWVRIGSGIFGART